MTGFLINRWDWYPQTFKEFINSNINLYIYFINYKLSEIFGQR